jgi:hypothetical protein
MRRIKAGQIPCSEVQEIYIFKIHKNRICCEKWVVSDLKYTILDSYVWIDYGLINNVC